MALLQAQETLLLTWDAGNLLKQLLEAAISAGDEMLVLQRNVGHTIHHRAVLCQDSSDFDALLLCIFGKELPHRAVD